MSSSGWFTRHREISLAALATAAIVAMRIMLARHLTFCGNPDTCAYLGLAQSLSQHHNFDLNFLYQYQFIGHHLPVTGIEYWRPGVSFLLLLAMPFGEVTLHAGMVLATLAGVALALAAWRIAMDTTGDPKLACASYLLCLVMPPLWGGSLAPDSPLFYGVFVAWFLALFTARARGLAYDIAALLCVASVNLIRNDTVLLFVPLLVVLWRRHRTASRSPERRNGTSPAYAMLMVAGFFAAMLPMALINHAALGRFSTGSAIQVLYLNDLSDLSRYGAPLTLHSMLAVGSATLIKLRVSALAIVIYRIVFLQVGFAAVFLATLWPRRSANEAASMPELAPGASLAVMVVLVYGLCLPAIAAFSALRAYVGLLPWIAVLIVVAIFRLTRAASATLPLVASVVLFYLIAGVLEDQRSIANKNLFGDRDRKLAAFLASHGLPTGNDTVIMTADAGQFSVTTGYACIPVPSNGIEAASAAAADLHASAVLIEDGQWTAQQIQTLFRPVAVDPVPDTSVTVLTLRTHTH